MDELDEPKKSSGKTKKSDEKIIEEAQKFLKSVQESESARQNSEKAQEALDFLRGEQWPSEVRRAREQEQRPCLVLDQCGQYVRQIVNDIRQAIPQIKIGPNDQATSKEGAEIIDGIIRDIQRYSVADNSYKVSVEHAASIGSGYLRVLTEYADEESFQQRIKIQVIANTMSVFLDPNAQERNASDAQVALIVTKMTRAQFKREYPDADQMDFDTGLWESSDWVTKDDVLVGEYFRIAYTEETITGTDGRGQTQTRTARIPSVEWMKLTAAEVVERTILPTRYIPIVRVVGNVVDGDGKMTITGGVHNAMEPARLYNYAASAFVENVALAPTAPFVAAAGQIERYKAAWQVAHKKNQGVLVYDPKELNGAMVPPPARQEPPGISAGWIAAMQGAKGDIQSSFGMYPASLGAQSNETAGIAIHERRSESDTVNFHYADNLSDAVRQVGRIVVDILPKIYDVKTTIRSIAEDGEITFVTLDPSLPVSYAEMENGQIAMNLSIGKYDVDVRTGPSFSTRRQEANEWMTSMIQATPQLMPIIGDIVFRRSELPGSEEISERLKLTLPEELRGEEGAGVPPQMIVEIKKREEALQQASMHIAELERKLTDKSDAAQINAQADIEKERLRQAAETDRAIINNQARMEQVIVEQTGKLMAAKASNADERSQQIRLAMAEPDPARRLMALEQLYADEASMNGATQ